MQEQESGIDPGWRFRWNPIRGIGLGPTSGAGSGALNFNLDRAEVDLPSEADVRRSGTVGTLGSAK
jgi:hypothetical protein